MSRRLEALFLILLTLESIKQSNTRNLVDVDRFLPLDELDQFAKETQQDILLVVPTSESMARHLFSFSSWHVIGVSLKNFLFREKDDFSE